MLMDTRFHSHTPVAAFAGLQHIASGPLVEVAARAHPWMDHHDTGPVLIFDDLTSHLVEVDFRGSPADVTARFGSMPTDGSSSQEEPAVAEAVAEKRGPGRPKIGVVAREVTLLPRHWEWLNQQPGGASVALRKLVEEARKTHADEDRKRKAIDAVHRFLHALAGDLPQFEEVTRAFHAGEHARMTDLMISWPEGVRAHALRLVARVGA